MLLWDNEHKLQRKDWINVIDAFTITYNSTVHHMKRCLVCIYDTSDKEENAIEVDEDNQMSVSDAVDEGTPLDHDTNPIFIK